MSYKDILKDRRWQKRRLEILNRDDFRCRICPDESTDNIHVHHKSYINNKEPWDYADNYLITVWFLYFIHSLAYFSSPSANQHHPGLVLAFPIFRNPLPALGMRS